MSFPRRLRLGSILLLACALLAQTAPPEPELAAEPEDDAPMGIEHGIDVPWQGDLDGMLERRRIRVLVVPSRTFYFLDKGTQRGLAHDQGKALEAEINKKRPKKSLHVDVVFVPVSYDDVIPALIQGAATSRSRISPSRRSASAGSTSRRRSGPASTRSRSRARTRPSWTPSTTWRGARSSCASRARTSRACGT
jgi:hypothetical protein